jgi:hypothetical protein
MRYVRRLWSTQTPVSFSGGASGTPAIAAAPDNCTYFATTARETGEDYALRIGCLDRTGAVVWQTRLPELRTNAIDSDAALCAGSGTTVYVAFSTTGAVPGRVNMSNVPSFCVDCSLGADPRDIVVARIDVVGGTPTVVWVVQDAGLNSCFGESRPALAYDASAALLYVAWECNKSIYCGVPFNEGPNIAIACYSIQGIQQWFDVTQQLNGTGQNATPAVAVDGRGGVYIAATMTAPIAGAPPIEDTQIEVIKYQRTGSGPAHARAFLLGLRAAGGPAFAPSLAADGAGTVYLACVTAGTFPGATKSAAIQDLAVVAFQETGAIRWIQQAAYNTATLPFAEAVTPVVYVDPIRKIPYVTLVARQADGGECVLFYKLRRDTGAPTEWMYEAAGGVMYTAYGYAYTGAPYAVFPTGPAATTGVYGKTAFCVVDGIFVGAFCTTQVAPDATKVAADTDVCITGFSQPLLYDFKTAYEYIKENKMLCTCNAATGGCGECR